MTNSVVLVGRLTKDPDLRYTASGTTVVTSTLAVNHNFTNQSGNREADFTNCMTWRKSAEISANHARKGILLDVTGHIQIRSYNNQQGQYTYVAEVIADNFQLLESHSAPESRQQSGGFQSSSQSAGGFDGNSNSNRTSQSSNGVPDFDCDTPGPFGSSPTIDISDDGLPF